MTRKEKAFAQLTAALERDAADILRYLERRLGTDDAAARLEFPEILGAWMMVAAGAWVAVFAMTAPWLIPRNPMRLAKDR